MSVDASREETIIQDLKSVAARLGLAIAQESADIVDTLRRWLETHQEWLIIFDNVPQDFVFTKYCPNNPRGLVFIISHYDLSPIEMRLAPIQVETMNPTEAYHQFCTELGLLPSEDHLSSSSRSPSHGLLDLKLSQPMQQLSSSQDDKVHRFLKVLGFHPLAVQLGIGWIRQRAKYHGEWTKSLDLFIKGFRAHGNAESVIESIAINMLIEPLMNRTKSPDNEDQQGSIEVLRFFSVIDSSGLPESLLEYGWNSIKRKRFNKVDKTSTWSKDRQKKLLGSYLKEKWDSHPIQEAIIDLMSSSLIYVVKQADPIKDSRPWISMHPALHLAVRRAILPRGKEGLMAACSDAIVTLAEMTSLSADADSRMSGHLDQRHSRQNIQSHMKYCFRLCPEVEEQLYAQEDGLIDRIEIVRKYAKACAENGMVSQALRINTRAIKALNESKRDDRVKRMILRVSIEQATNYHDLGKHRDALDIRKKLLTDATDQSIYGSDLYRVCKMNLVRSYHFDRQNLNALRLIEEVITDSGSDPGSEELKNSTSRLKASILFSLESRRPEALQIRQSILQSILGARNAKHMETILSKSGKRAWKFGQISLLSDLATSYHTAGWLLLAKKIRGLVLDHRKKWFPHFPEHHDVLTAQYNLAITLDSLGEAESAEKLLMETGESCKKLSQGGDSLGFQVNLSLKTMKIEVGLLTF